MPKRTNLTANKLNQRPGWFPPIQDVPGTTGKIYGDEKFFKANKEYFHKMISSPKVF